MARGMPAGTRTVEQLLTTRTQLDQHFKSIGLRDAEFRKQKLHLQERLLKTARKDRNAAQGSERGEGVPLRRTAPPAAVRPAGRGRLLQTSSMPELSRLPDPYMRMVSTDPGLSRTRFCAAVPVSHHPAVHPGAVSAKLAEALQEGRGSPGRSASAAGRLALAGGPRTPPSPGGGSPVGREVSSFRPVPAAQRLSPAACPQNLGIGEDPLWTTDPCEEELQLLEEGGTPCGSGVVRPPEPHLVLERFGDMLQLLGPRYKTLPHGVIWDRAVLEGTTTPLQRRMMRSLEPPPSMPAKKRVPPEDVPDMDTEKATRASWLAIRRQQRLQRERQQQHSHAAPA